MWSFVGGKKDVWWVWAALDAGTRQVVAIVCTDFLAQYKAIVPEDRHAAAGKDAGLTAHIERFWLTVRQRVGRVVRRTLSFSKCCWNHVGALWDFVRHYNASLL